MECRKLSGIIKKSNRCRYLFILAFIIAAFFILTELPEVCCSASSSGILIRAALLIFVVSWTYSEQWLIVSSTVSKKGAVHRGVRLSRIAQVHGFDYDEYFIHIAKHQIVHVVILMLISTLSFVLNFEYDAGMKFEKTVLIYTAAVVMIPLISYGTLYLKKMIFQSSACLRKESFVYEVVSLLVNLFLLIYFSWIVVLLSFGITWSRILRDHKTEVPAKPVIYIYPEETMEVSVKVNINETGHLTYTYPQYDEEEGWNVTAEPGSVLYDESGREYSYLFWEGVSDHDWDMESGFVVKGSDTVPFLQEKLEYLGLTPKEYNEFIVYWMPKMQDNEYNLISFQTEKYEEYAALEITPQPDSIQRVFMAYEPLDRYIEIPEQQLQSFERHGYTVIEWGGVEIK